MPSFSKNSLDKLNELHPNLQKVLLEAIKHVDFTITCGYRGEAEQNKAFAEGKSKLKFPNGEHNKQPSMAVDVAPYPCNWNDNEAFTYLAGVIWGIGATMGIKLRCGIDWDGDFNTVEHGFKDRPHIELV